MKVHAREEKIRISRRMGAQGTNSILLPRGCSSKTETKGYLGSHLKQNIWKGNLASKEQKDKQRTAAVSTNSGRTWASLILYPPATILCVGRLRTVCWAGFSSSMSPARSAGWRETCPLTGNPPKGLSRRARSKQKQRKKTPRTSKAEQKGVTRSLFHF